MKGPPGNEGAFPSYAYRQHPPGILKMIKIENGKQVGAFLSPKEYYADKGLPARLIMPLTKRLRAYHAGRYMEGKETHLDIGCGDGYFMKRSKCRIVYGIDKRYGDSFSGSLDFLDNYFDYVTMLAVLEHLEMPEVVFKEIYRVLKSGGKFIFTTPPRRAAPFIKMIVRNIGELHTCYYDRDTVKRYSTSLFREVDYRTFLLGRNQVFCLQKLDRETAGL